MTIRKHQAALWAVLILCLFGERSIAQPSFTPHPQNPVLAYGAASDWDSGILFIPDIVLKDGTYYLFYTASPDLMSTPLSIGFATSPDGVNWTKNTSNPVFESDGTGFDAFQTASSRILVEGESWSMFYNGRDQPGPGPGPYIGRATSADPAGPWSVADTPVLETGSPGEWDSGFVDPNAVIPVDSGYVMYYSGGTGFPFPPNNRARVGMATSTDGITWTKYDDPSTTSAPFAESDPVLDIGDPGTYDSGLAWAADVVYVDGRWEMFYTCDPDTFPFESICFATSTDGIVWEKAINNPIYQHTQDGSWASLEVVLGSVLVIDEKRYMYYMGNTSLFDGQIGLATENTSTAVESTVNPDRQPVLHQNYPNPFSDHTTIRFSLRQPGHVRLVVYNMLGQQTHVLVDAAVEAGLHEVGVDSQSLPAGTYWYKLQTSQGDVRGQMVRIK